MSEPFNLDPTTLRPKDGALSAFEPAFEPPAFEPSERPALEPSEHPALEALPLPLSSNVIEDVRSTRRVTKMGPESKPTPLSLRDLEFVDANDEPSGVLSGRWLEPAPPSLPRMPPMRKREKMLAKSTAPRIPEPVQSDPSMKADRSPIAPSSSMASPLFTSPLLPLPEKRDTSVRTWLWAVGAAAVVVTYMTVPALRQRKATVTTTSAVVPASNVAARVPHPSPPAAMDSPPEALPIATPAATPSATPAATTARISKPVAAHAVAVAAGGVPADPSALLDLATSALHKADYVRAQKLYRALVAREPHSVDALSGLGGAAHGLGQNSDAIANYRSALRYSPGFYPARLGLADALWDSGEQDAARREYSEISKLYPDRVLPARARERQNVSSRLTLDEGNPASQR